MDTPVEQSAFMYRTRVLFGGLLLAASSLLANGSGTPAEASTPTVEHITIIDRCGTERLLGNVAVRAENTSSPGGQSTGRVVFDKAWQFEMRLCGPDNTLRYSADVYSNNSNKISKVAIRATELQLTTPEADIENEVNCTQGRSNDGVADLYAKIRAYRSTIMGRTPLEKQWCDDGFTATNDQKHEQVTDADYLAVIPPAYMNGQNVLINNPGLESFVGQVSQTRRFAMETALAQKFTQANNGKEPKIVVVGNKTPNISKFRQDHNKAAVRNQFKYALSSDKNGVTSVVNTPNLSTTASVISNDYDPGNRRFDIIWPATAKTKAATK